MFSDATFVISNQIIFSYIFYVGILTLIGVLVFYKKQFNYWKNKNVKVTNPWFPLGDIFQAGFNKNFGIVLKEIYDKFPGERFNGCWFFYRPFFMIRDPELIKIIFVKDFEYFKDRGVYLNKKIDPLGANLFFLKGKKWRNYRMKLTSNFSSGKMKKMYESMLKKSIDLQEGLEKFADNGETINAKYYAERYTNDVAASCLLGFQAKCLKDPNALLRIMGNKIFEPSWKTLIKNSISFLVPDIGILFRVRVTPDDVTSYFTNTLKSVINIRENEKNNNHKGYNDVIQMLVNWKKQNYYFSGDNEFSFTMDDAIAQAFIFWVGAFEFTSLVIQFALYEFSINTQIQEKARKEIKNICEKFNGTLTYEALPYLEYLSRVVNETLRKYPPVPLLLRKCVKQYHVPNSNVVIEKGTPIIISVLGLHMDPKYFPNPEKFDPERFTDEEKIKRHNYAYLPFGEGLHQCLGLRFSLIQIKIGLANLLIKYKFDVAPETPKKLKFCPKLILYTVQNGIPLKISKLQD